MPGLDPGIHATWADIMKEYYVYILASQRNGTLYVGVTSNLARRIWEHREGVIDSFTKRYGVTRLVYCESYSDVRFAIQRERNIKHWSRAWKIALIEEHNPDWDDLYASVLR